MTPVIIMEPGELSGISLLHWKPPGGNLMHQKKEIM